MSKFTTLSADIVQNQWTSVCRGTAIQEVIGPELDRQIENLRSYKAEDELMSLTDIYVTEYRCDSRRAASPLRELVFL